MAADAAIHGSFNLMVCIVKFKVIGRLKLNLINESASGSVDGRVRGHDETGEFIQTASQR
jgi:hypothetical protein